VTKQVSLRNHSSEWQSFARRLKRLIHEALKLVVDRKRIVMDARSIKLELNEFNKRAVEYRKSFTSAVRYS
jgi:hypothetical protein